MKIVDFILNVIGSLRKVICKKLDTIIFQNHKIILDVLMTAFHCMVCKSHQLFNPVKVLQPVVVAHACNLGLWEAEAEGSGVHG